MKHRQLWRVLSWTIPLGMLTVLCGCMECCGAAICKEFGTIPSLIDVT